MRILSCCESTFVYLDIFQNWPGNYRENPVNVVTNTNRNPIIFLVPNEIYFMVILASSSSSSVVMAEPGWGEGGWNCDWFSKWQRATFSCLPSLPFTSLRQIFGIFILSLGGISGRIVCPWFEGNLLESSSNISFIIIKFLLIRTIYSL